MSPRSRSRRARDSRDGELGNRYGSLTFVAQEAAHDLYASPGTPPPLFALVSWKESWLTTVAGGHAAERGAQRQDGRVEEDGGGA